LALIVTLIVAAPVPLVGCTVIQLTKFCTAQLQFGPVVRISVRCPPAASTDRPVVSSE
jgi:hypothetical protein